MILESKHIDFTVIDITEPTQEKEKDFMQANSTEMGITVSDANPRHPLPPQIFNGEQYCGDYNGFELSNENDELEAFLKIEVKNGVSSAPPAVVIAEPETTTTTIISEEVAVNGKGDEEKPDNVETAEPLAATEPETTTETVETNNDEAAAPDEKIDSEKTAEE